MEPTLDARFQRLISWRSASDICNYNTAKNHDGVWTGGLSADFGGLRAGEIPTRADR